MSVPLFQAPQAAQPTLGALRSRRLRTLCHRLHALIREPALSAVFMLLCAAFVSRSGRRRAQRSGPDQRQRPAEPGAAGARSSGRQRRAAAHAAHAHAVAAGQAGGAGQLGQPGTGQQQCRYPRLEESQDCIVLVLPCSPRCTPGGGPGTAWLSQHQWNRTCCDVCLVTLGQGRHQHPVKGQHSQALLKKLSSLMSRCSP